MDVYLLCLEVLLVVLFGIGMWALGKLIFGIYRRLTRKVFYVSPTGSDANSDHDPASPLLTIGAAVDAAAAGDCIMVLPGSYRAPIHPRPKED